MANNPAGRAKDAFEKAKAAAAPKIAKAQSEAAPRAEKAAKKAGTLFGQLKDQATKTAKGFKEGYQPGGDEPSADKPAEGDRPKPGPGTA